MKKNMFLLGLFIALLLFLTTTETSLKFAKANPSPYLENKAVPPPVRPTFTFFSPENNTLRNLTTLTISFKVSIEFSNAWLAIKGISYNTSWQIGNFTLYNWSGHDFWNTEDNDPYITEFSHNLTLTNIPEGKQTVTIIAWGEGDYAEGAVLYSFFTGNSSSISFTVDTTPPPISILELENNTYAESEVALNFAVNESVSKISYALDGQENVTINGNITLTGLSNRAHNVKIYVWDAARNVGSSETVTFTVAAEAFPVVPVAVAFLALVAVVGGGLLVYFRKRKRKKAETNSNFSGSHVSNHHGWGSAITRRSTKLPAKVHMQAHV